MRHVGVGQCEVLVAALPPRADQTRMFELRQLRSGRLRRDPARAGQFALRARLAPEPAGQHARPRRFSHLPGDAGKARFRAQAADGACAAWFSVPVTPCANVRSSFRMKRFSCAQAKLCAPSSSARRRAR